MNIVVSAVFGASGLIFITEAVLMTAEKFSMEEDAPFWGDILLRLVPTLTGAVGIALLVGGGRFANKFITKRP